MSQHQRWGLPMHRAAIDPNTNPMRPADMQSDPWYRKGLSESEEADLIRRLGVGSAGQIPSVEALPLDVQSWVRDLPPRSMPQMRPMAPNPEPPLPEMSYEDLVRLVQQRWGGQ